MRVWTNVTDRVGGPMVEVVANTKQLSAADREEADRITSGE